MEYDQHVANSSHSKQSNPTQANTFLKKILSHMELINAISSGIIIMLVWIFSSYVTDQMWIILHVVAFIIGGYYKAKEGITETFKNKDLNVEMLMVFAAIGAASIGYWTEGAILIFIFALSGALETYTMEKSKHAISSLMEKQPEEALLLQNGKEKMIPVSELSIDDKVLVRAGERIPADGAIIKGSTSIDESAITGESIPVTKFERNQVYASTVALDGSITINITTKPNETLFQKIIALVQTAQDEKSPSQQFIERFEGVYVKVVLIVVGFMMFLPYFMFGWSLSESLYRAMILLVVASPCALVASISPASLSAISNSAKKGVLFKGGGHLEKLSHMKAIALDKTGTLTNGKPIVTDAYFSSNKNKDQIVAIAGAIERESTHPLANAITSYSEKETTLDLHEIDVLDMKTESGKGVKATIDNEKWKLGNMDYVGRKEAELFHHGIASTLTNQGKTTVFIKVAHQIIGVFALKDTVRDTTKETIHQLKQQNIHTIMLTGDNELTAKSVVKEVGLDHYIANCLPQDKVKAVKKIGEDYKNVGMIGDGINDAPALASANIGIAMGEGTDVALETADIVLMNNDLSKITDAIHLSNRMNLIIKQNIVFSLSIIGLLILTNYFQIIDMPLGVIGHEGSTILVILNGLRLLK